MKTKPISPDEILSVRESLIPDDVFVIFNDFIAKNWDGHQAMIMQDVVVGAIAGALDVSRDHVYSQHWVDVEDHCRKAGWVVDYDKPGYNESYEAYFVFKKKKVKR